MPWYVRLGLVRSRLHAALVASRRPIVVQRGPTREIRRLLVCVRDARSQKEVLLAGLDLARLADASIDALTVEAPGTQPSNLGDIARLGRLYGVELVHRCVSGNPVAQIRASAAAYDAVVLGLRAEHNSPLGPDVSTFLLHDLPVTAVFVPWSPAG